MLDMSGNLLEHFWSQDRLWISQSCISLNALPDSLYTVPGRVYCLCPDKVKRRTMSCQQSILLFLFFCYMLKIYEQLLFLVLRNSKTRRVSQPTFRVKKKQKNKST